MAILARMQRTSRGPVAMAEAAEESLKEPGDYETCRIGKCTFTFPVEMLELPDLRSILSLDSWNYCLTEEDREHLMSFLPADLNQEEFATILKQLLGGDNFNFGNPVDGFLEQMKKGWLHPSVVSYKNGYRELQKKEHEFQIKKYHDGMVKGFLEMQKLWEDYPDVDIRDRIEIWRKWKETNVKPEHPGNAKLLAAQKATKPSKKTNGRENRKAAGVLKVKVKPGKQQEEAKPAKVVPLQQLTKCTPKGVLKTTKKAVPDVLLAGSDTDTSTGDDESPQLPNTSSSLSSGRKRKNSSPDNSSQKKAKQVDSGATSSEGILSPKPELADWPCPANVEASSEEKGKKKADKDSSESPPVRKLASSACGLPFSVIHFLSAVRRALLSPYGGASTAGCNSSTTKNIASPVQEMDETGSDNDGTKPGMLFMVPLPEIVRRVHANLGDPRALETQPGTQLQDLVWGALKVLSSKTAPGGAKGWKPLAAYEKETKSWSWVGPVAAAAAGAAAASSTDVAPEDWGISPKVLAKLEQSFATWYKHGEETRQQLVQLQGPPPVVSTPVDEKERFRDKKAQKSLVTIAPSSNVMREYFRKEELVRYSVPDRAFTYRRSDGQKAVVAPLRRGGGKPNSKPRDHFMLKPGRPPHVTVLCLVRDAAARLPGGVGTRADVCALMRDSQYIVEDVTDEKVNQVVSGALDRLHYEVDPCVRFDSERKLWMYLHTDRNEEDFDDDGTSSTKRWKKQKKDGVEGTADMNTRQFEECSPSGMEFQDAAAAAAADDNIHHNSNNNQPQSQCAIYSADRTELVYSKSSSLSSPRVLHNSTSVLDTMESAAAAAAAAAVSAAAAAAAAAAANHEAEQVAWHSIGTVWSQEAEQKLKEAAAAKAAAEAAAAAEVMEAGTP